MKFREWTNKIDALQGNTLFDISESLSVKGSSVLINVGKNGVTCEIDSVPEDLRQCRSLFTYHKEEFEGLLEGLQERCESAFRATNTIVAAAAYDAIPAAVIERLKGNEPGDDYSLVRKRCEDKLMSWVPQLRQLDRLFGELHFAFPLNSDIGTDPLNLIIQKISGSMILHCGAFKSSTQDAGVTIVSEILQDQLMFIGNADYIQSRLDEFVRIVRKLRYIK